MPVGLNKLNRQYFIGLEDMEETLQEKISTSYEGFLDLSKEFTALRDYVERRATNSEEIQKTSFVNMRKEIKSAFKEHLAYI